MNNVTPFWYMYIVLVQDEMGLPAGLLSPTRGPWQRASMHCFFNFAPQALTAIWPLASLLWMPSLCAFCGGVRKERGPHPAFPYPLQIAEPAGGLLWRPVQTALLLRNACQDMWDSFNQIWRLVQTDIILRNNRIIFCVNRYLWNFFLVKNSSTGRDHKLTVFWNETFISHSNQS